MYLVCVSHSCPVRLYPGFTGPRLTVKYDIIRDPSQENRVLRFLTSPLSETAEMACPKIKLNNGVEIPILGLGDPRELGKISPVPFLCQEPPL